MPTMKQLKKAAKAQGWDVTVTGSGHVLFISPTGERVILVLLLVELVRPGV